MSKFQFQRHSTLYSNGHSGVTIYSGLLLLSNTRIAVKEQLLPDISAVNSIISEALAMCNLDHPGICRVFDCFLEQDQSRGLRAVLLVELMESDLEKLTRERKARGIEWTDEELFGFLATLIDALAYAQSRHISHRDLKPQNIFITGSTIKVGDFGSSNRSLVDSLKQQTLAGSPLFMSPEQKKKFSDAILTGSSGEFYDPYRSDVYSLGITMLCLTSSGPPVQLMNLDNLQEETDRVLGALVNYPQLASWLRVMLLEHSTRPSFVELKQMMTASLSMVTQLGYGDRSGQQLLQPLPSMQGGAIPYTQMRKNSDAQQCQNTPAGIINCSECASWFIPTSHSRFCSLGCEKRSKARS